MLAGAGSNLEALAVASVALEEGVALAVVLAVKAVVEAMAAAMVAEVKVAELVEHSVRLDSMAPLAATLAGALLVEGVAVLFLEGTEAVLGETVRN